MSSKSRPATAIVVAAIMTSTADQIMTPTPITAATQPVPTSFCVNKAQLVAAVSVPDGTVFPPGAQFTKIWRLRNISSCGWITSYQIMFVSGEKPGAASPVGLTEKVVAGETLDISLDMTAPTGFEPACERIS